MAEKSHLLGLMARRETVRLMQAQGEFRQIRDRHAEAARMAERLAQMLESRRVEEVAPLAAADLFRAHRMNLSIAEQVERSAAQAADLSQAMAAAQEAMARQDHRTQALQDAAAIARTAEAEDRLARAEAQRPTARARG
ncbi:flagellar FliJ protein [Cereibacter ovatus]|uniref:Flagellar FliJ protein n=1 Tax=Cereibacter ovatus TaxID=439529 RepID=A0A285CJK1_9RHOB|nr:flagellar biosynthesis protein FliJ [Cereibacter ovatus]SNX67774.1 flagellar FliJ protein [Cereibacter ovatus]